MRAISIHATIREEWTVDTLGVNSGRGDRNDVVKRGDP